MTIAGGRKWHVPPSRSGSLRPSAKQTAGRPKPRRRKVSAKARAAWKAQGRYMAAVRRLSKADRAKVRAVREKSGIRAAIKLHR